MTTVVNLDELVEKAKSGDVVARNKIILELDKTIKVLSYKKSKKDFELKNDLEQEAIFGIIRAIDLYDTSYGASFATYAFYWINQSMGKYLANKNDTIKVPQYLEEAKSVVTRAEEKLTSILDRTPTRNEVIEFLQKDSRFNYNINKLDFYHGKHNICVSLKQPLSGEDASDSITLEETLRIEDDTFINPEIIKNNDEVSAKMEKALRNLDPRSERILRLRFGIGTDKEHTLREISAELDCTVEYARQLQNKALTSLQKNVIIKKMKKHLNEG